MNDTGLEQEFGQEDDVHNLTLSDSCKNAIQGEQSTSEVPVEPMKLGRAAELSAFEKLKQEDPTAIDLNEVDTNFKIYDVASSDKVVSVKQYGLDYGESLPDSILANYRSAFRVSMGGGTSPSKFEEAATTLQDLKKSGADLPLELIDRPKEYLRDHSEMWIPKGHVEQVKNDLRSRLLSDEPIEREVYASQFGLNEKSANYQENVEKLLERIQSFE